MFSLQGMWPLERECVFPGEHILLGDRMCLPQGRKKQEQKQEQAQEQKQEQEQEQEPGTGNKAIAWRIRMEKELMPFTIPPVFLSDCSIKFFKAKT